MATYKVIQDIEAEDKLLGPLSFRQFLYFLVAAFLGYLSFIAITKGAAFLLVVLVPPMLFCLFFAWPWSPDQPTEVWALARIRFMFKPRKRIWNQSGIKELVTITAPKKIERNYTDGLSQSEVKSRLQALATTIDSRGWAAKNAFSAPTVVAPSNQSDRLLDFDNMPREVPAYDVTDKDDILDEINNPMAYHMNEMIDASEKARRHDLIARLQAAGASTPSAPPAPQWFQRSQASTQPITVAPIQPTGLPQAPAYADDLQALPAPLPNADSHLKTLSPLPSVPEVQAVRQQVATATSENISQPATPRQPDPAILTLAHDNNLDVATLAREAKRARGEESDGEVVISLH